MAKVKIQKDGQIALVDEANLAAALDAHWTPVGGAEEITAKPPKEPGFFDLTPEKEAAIKAAGQKTRDDFAAGASQFKKWLTGGLTDEAAQAGAFLGTALGNATIGVDPSFQADPAGAAREAEAEQLAKEEEAWQRSPAAGAVGSVGGVLAGGMLGGGGQTFAQRAKTLVPMGAATGYFTTEGDTADEILGLLGGAAGGMVGAGIPNAVEAAKRGIPAAVDATKRAGAAIGSGLREVGSAAGNLGRRIAGVVDDAPPGVRDAAAVLSGGKSEGVVRGAKLLGRLFPSKPAPAGSPFTGAADDVTEEITEVLVRPQAQPMSAIDDVTEQLDDVQRFIDPDVTDAIPAPSPAPSFPNSRADIATQAGNVDESAIARLPARGGSPTPAPVGPPTVNARTPTPRATPEAPAPEAPAAPAPPPAPVPAAPAAPARRLADDEALEVLLEAARKHGTTDVATLASKSGLSTAQTSRIMQQAFRDPRTAGELQSIFAAGRAPAAPPSALDEVAAGLDEVADDVANAGQNAAMRDAAERADKLRTLAPTAGYQAAQVAATNQAARWRAMMDALPNGQERVKFIAKLLDEGIPPEKLRTYLGLTKAEWRRMSFDRVGNRKTG